MLNNERIHLDAIQKFADYIKNETLDRAGKYFDTLLPIVKGMSDQSKSAYLKQIISFFKLIVQKKEYAEVWDYFTKFSKNLEYFSVLEQISFLRELSTQFIFI